MSQPSTACSLFSALSSFSPFSPHLRTRPLLPTPPPYTRDTKRDVAHPYSLFLSSCSYHPLRPIHCLHTCSTAFVHTHTHTPTLALTRSPTCPPPPDARCLVTPSPTASHHYLHTKKRRKQRRRPQRTQYPEYTWHRIGISPSSNIRKRGPI